MSDFLQSYQQHVDERAALGIVPKPLDAEQTAQLIELLKNPPADKADFLLKFIRKRVSLLVLMKPPM